MPDLCWRQAGRGHMDGETRAILYMLETNLGLQVRVEQVAWEDFLGDLNRQFCSVYLRLNGGLSRPAKLLDCYFTRKAHRTTWVT